MNKEDLQEFAKKYLNADKNKIINSEHYGEYNIELVAILKWDGENTKNSSNIQSYIYEHSGSKSYVLLKEFKPEYNIENTYKDSFLGDVIGLYSAT